MKPTCITCTLYSQFNTVTNFKNVSKKPIKFLWAIAASIILLFAIKPDISFAQSSTMLDKQITIQLNDTYLEDVLKAAAQKAGCKFSYNTTAIDGKKKVSVNYNQLPLQNVLYRLLGNNTSLQVSGNQVFIRLGNGKGTVKGTVRTRDGQPAELVTVGFAGGVATTVDKYGNYLLKNTPEGKQALTASFIGLGTQSKQILIEANKTAEVNFILSENSEQLKEVVVSYQRANKFNRKTTSIAAKLPLTNLENPQVYTTISKELLTEQITTDLSDGLRNTPGIIKMQASIGRSGDGAVYYNLRGFPTRISMIDGIAGQTNGDIDPANIEKTEVIKGPSGTLFGGALTSFGGLINVVTKKPIDTLGGEVAYTTGSFNLNRLTADLYGPVNKTGNLLFRVNAAYHYRNSFQDAGFRKSVFVAPVLEYRVNKKLNLNLSAEFYNYEGTNPSIVFLHRSRPYIAISPAELDYNWKRSYTSNDITLKAPSSNIHGKATYKLSNFWTSQTNFAINTRKTDGIYQYQFIRGNTSDALVERNVQLQNSTGTTINLQQNFTGDFKIAGLRHRMIVGVDYLNQSANNSNSGIVKFDTVSAVNGIQSANYTNINRVKAEAKIAASKVAPVRNYSSSNIFSVYASDALNITDELLVMLSLRVDRFQSLGTINQTTDKLLDDSKYGQTALSPKFGLVYQLVKDQVSLFANYMNSFSNVAPVTQPVADISGTFKPQHANQLEGGIKLDLFQNRLSFTASYYDIKVSNITFTETLIRDQSYNITVQRGNQKSQGIELELIANPISGLNVIAGYSHNDSKLLDAAPELQGRRPVSAGPADLINGWISYTMSQGDLKGLGVGFGGNYSGKFLSGNSKTTGQFIFPAYTLLNTTAFYDAKAYRIGFKLDNLTDKLYFTGQGVLSPQMPRNFSANITFKF